MSLQELENNPAHASPAVSAMQNDGEWDLITALRGGTRAMRAAKEKYLPKFGLEPDKKYADRLARSTLYPAFTETVAALVGRVFFEPLTAGDDVPQLIKEAVLPDIDRQGSTSDSFFKSVLDVAMAYGISGVLVESPPVSGPGPLTVAQEKEQRIRPYAIHVPPSQWVGWRIKDGILTQLRLRFWREEDAGEFGTKTVEQIRVYQLNEATEATKRQVSVATYERVVDNGKPTDKWTMIGGLVIIDVPLIPFVAFYTKRTGQMAASPPLLQLAHQNHKHWILQSALDDLTVTATVPILVQYGGRENQEIAIGSKLAVTMPASGKLAYTEHSGAAIGTARTELDTLKDEMRDSGSRMLVDNSGTKTATQSKEEATENNSDLAGIVRDTENAMAQVLDFFVMYSGPYKAGSGGRLIANANLDPMIDPTVGVDALVKLNTAGALSTETLFKETQRYGLVDESIKWEEEKARIDKEGEAAAELMAKTMPINGDPLQDPEANPAPKKPGAVPPKNVPPNLPADNE